MKSPNPEPIDGSKTLLKDGFATPVIVIPHEGHSYDSTTGKCTICGKRCGHTDVDSKTGVCSTCKYQLTAGISGAGTAKYFDNIDDAFTAALSAENNGCTLTLYKNCEITQNVEIGNTTVTVDVNGCSLGGEADISVNNGGVLYLKDSRKSTYYGCIDAPFSVNGGTLINGTADGGSSAADVLNLVINSAKCVEIYGGIFENVYIAHASGVALYGGRYNTICGEESNTPVNALLAKGYAFAILNSVTHLPESIVDGSAVTLSEGIRNVTVVKHTHTYTETETKCACGAVLYAKVTSADGTTNEYFDSIEEGLLYADKAENKGCVFTLVTSGKINSGVRLSNGQFTITTSNYGTIYDYNQTITIDGADVIAEGYMFIRCKVNVKSGSLTLPEGSGAGFDSIAISGGTVTVSEGVNVDNNAGADNLFVSEDATDAKLTIGGGTYGNVYLGQFKLKDVIASGVRVISYDNPTDPTAEKTAKALLYSDIAEKNNFDSENNTVSYYLFTKCEHKNEDGSYAFNDSGICKYCNSEFAASVSYTVDGSAKTELFSNICDAFDKANEIGTATVTLYKDITDSERTQEITVMGNVTLELNGKTLGGRYGIARISVSDGGTLTVNGDGDMDTPIYVNENSKLVINGGGYFNSVSVKKGGNAEIGGGTIQGLSVRGNVKLSGGKFNDIEIFNGNLESVLADGYAYKNADGTWLSIDEREKDSYLGGSKGALSVEEAPIKSASISWAGGEAPVIYRNGAKKLKVNVICDVADTSKRITYSDYVNGNNRSKDSKLSVNWYMVFGYKIGEIVAEDGEVEYYTVLKCDGYEYKSNALKFTLATCSHPEDSFNNETDGLVFCGICDLLIEAEVVDADGKSLGYADIESAIKLAQENEGSTVKLISERVPASITVTGGKFTVDFNGKEAYCQFTVNGGDVTFTSSAVQDVSNQNLPSGITVNGTDAEVTIDGKIKLGRVRIISSTLTVNSTDGYIGELSIEGGNAVIDGANIDALSINGGATVINGANIDALKANGGDTVINDVNADSLAMCDNRSGGSEYNISIVSGRFGSFTCENGSNYTLGRAIASGSVVSADSMNGITVYTYEAIQTMTSTYRIFVDKCNHKDKNGSYVLDGNPCPYCNEEIVATVSYTAGGSENTDLFSDIYDAFERANEIGTATVTLQKNITDDITDTIAVTGNVTLELNGKRLSQPGTDVWYSIEVTSGKLTVNGSGLIKRVAVCNGSDAEINGGTLSDFIIKDGGNAVIKGGQFYSLQVSGEGRNVGQLLADGYAYWSFIDSGIWSTIAEREKQDIANVEVRTAPIKSATATANKTVLYRNGGGARQILFNFNVNTSDGYTISDANKVTVGLYVGDTLIRELDFVGNSYTFANADEISDTDGTVKAHLVIKLNGYEYVTDDVEFEMATCTHPYDALTTDEHDYYRCSLCDASINAILVKTNGDKACYTDNVPEAFEAAQLEENNGCTLELYRGVNRDCEITQGSFTVLFKKTGSASAVIKVSGGNVKITGDDGCTLSKYPGSSVGYLIAVTGGTVTFDDITINDDSISVSGGKTVINGGTYNKLSVSGGTVTINSGTFSSIDVSAEGKALKDLLGENKAFTTSDGKLFDASKVSESDNSLTVIDHSKHEYDETGRCGCGYQCAHSEINAEGVCNECNAKMYAAVTVKSETGTTVKYFTKLTEAFEFAAKNENKGCTLKMLRDFFDRNTDINVNGGELTVDMNGFGVYINSFNGSGTQITIRSDSKCTFGVENGFSMDGGTVTFSGEVSVVCQNVKLNATYFSSYVETLKIDTLILEDGVLLKQLASITNANIANIDCSSEIYLYQILASGSRVDSQLYSDLKANASSNFDNVRIIRCDHPDGVGRDNRCIYCNSLIAASVSYTENGAEKTEYFVKEDLGKAFAKANSVAIATITMLMSSAYDTDYLPVTGDVTLIANGDNAILYNTVKVADGGKLTLRGNANIFAVIAEPGSRLTAEEATRIAYLTVNGGDVKLSGGQYDNITVKDGKITDILGNGYAYKKTEGGAWLTLKEREVSEASGVTVAKAPIVQATLSTEMNKLYRNSNANSTLKFNLSLANGSNLNDSYVSKRYGINSYVSGDIIYSSLSALVKDAKLSADEIIDKAGDSDVAEIYFVVTTGDGYEIKSNTVSIDLVDCDHSQVVDPTADKETAGNITEPTYCEICESKFNAKITKGDDVKYYNNLDEAAKDAQKSENEGCTLYPLYNKNGYGGQLVITEGNFTLKYAVRTAFSRPIIINGKAKLTVTGRCAVTAFENQDAFIVQGGDVTFEGLATGSNVTINGGNVTMAANNINCLTINGGNVSISSGGFAEIITNAPNKVIADYIDPGFWVQDRGTKEWIDIYSLNKATASSTNGLTVRLCPMQIIKPIDTVYYTNGYYPGDIPSLQINAEPWYSNEVDAKVAYQWFAIDENGYETVIEGATDRKLSLENLTTGRYYCRLTYSNATTAGVSMASDVVTATITECEHSGGEATCTEKAKCEICGAEYGEPLGHDYVVIKVVEPDYRNEGYSVFECTRCKDSYIGNRVPVKPIPDVEEIAVEKTTYNEVDISWKNISGVDGYYVECYVGNQWKQIGFSTDGDRVAAKLSGLSAGLKYKVRIAAYAGSFTAKFRCFYVDTVPSPVWNINTVKATDETVRISWSRNARADGYKVEWYINNQWSVKTVTGNNNISAVIDGLCAGTRYKVRVSAYKGDLYSPYTYGYIDTLPSKVTGITKTVTSSSFTLKWDKNESADGYTAQYYADGKWNEKTLTGNNKTTVTIGSLKGYKTYKVRIKAYKGELESAFDDIYITTAPTKVSGLKVKSAVDSKAVVIWNADANADGYNVEYYIGGKWVKKTITDNKTAKAVLGGLTPYSTCKVRVRAYKDNLYGDYSYTTVTAVLSPVTNIKVVSAKSNSITVKWGKNASADGYKVEIYKGGKWVKKTLKGSTNATVTIGGLRAGSVYKVRIASYKGANTSTYTYANVKTAK
jgi:fibronectin type III domain